MVDKMEAIDQISGLPPFIIHRIMSLLKPKQVVQTSVLSKTWNHLWDSYPVLDFDQNQILRREFVSMSHSSFTENHDVYESIKRFAKYIDNTLRQFCQLKLQMQKFRLVISAIDVELCAMVDEWIELAIESGVREIYICVLQHGDKSYTLPQTFLSARCIRTLKTYGCNWMQPFASYDLQLHFLEKLYLGGAYVSEEMIQNFTSQCPLLEDFSLSHCRCLKRFDVSEVCKVKAILLEEVNDLEIIKIASQTLQFFALRRCRMTPCMINMEGCKNLTKVLLLYVKISDREFHNLIQPCPCLRI